MKDLKKQYFEILLLSLFFSQINTEPPKVDQLIAQKISQSHQMFVDSLIAELKIGTPISSYYMNKKGQEIFGPNTIVTYDGTLLIGPDFLDSLTLSEKRFSVARELLLIEFLQKNEEVIYLRDFMFASIFTVPTYKFLRKYIPDPQNRSFSTKHYDYIDMNYNNRYRDHVLAMLCLSFAASMIIFFIKSEFSFRGITYKIDAEAAIKLNDFDGAINYLNNYDKYYSQHNDLESIIPSNCKERINRLKKLKAAYRETC